MKLDHRRNYLARIKNSLGNDSFRNLYSTEGRDLTQNGKLSCAVFVSSLLLTFRLTPKPRATINNLILDMKEYGWHAIGEFRAGSVIVWKEMPINNELHKHIGFCLEEGIAISNSSILGHPIKHRINKNNRQVDIVLWHSALDDPNWDPWRD